MHTATELAAMSEDFLDGGATGLEPHALHDEMLDVVRCAMNGELRLWLTV